MGDDVIMKIKQQKMIKAFLIEEFGSVKGTDLFSKQVIIEEESYNYIRKYMLNKIASKKHASMQKMEVVPGFYSIYSKIFLKIMKKTDLQENEQIRLAYDIHEISGLFLP